MFPRDLQELSSSLVTAVCLCSSSAGLEPGHSLQLQVAPFLPFLGVCLLSRELKLFLEDYFALKVSAPFDEDNQSSPLSDPVSNE